MSAEKKMYKVFTTFDKKGGGTYWMRLGTAFTNRDDSINLYLDAIPPPDPASKRYVMQIREYTDEDRRRNEAYRGSGSSSSSDYGGLGGGPTHSASSRAVTANAASGASDVPF